MDRTEFLIPVYAAGGDLKPPKKAVQNWLPAKAADQ